MKEIIRNNKKEIIRNNEEDNKKEDSSLKFEIHECTVGGM